MQNEAIIEDEAMFFNLVKKLESDQGAKITDSEKFTAAEIESYN